MPPTRSVQPTPELLAIALDVFENEDGARTWLTSPAFGLGGRVPLDVAQTDAGRREVETLLKRIDYGIP